MRELMHEIAILRVPPIASTRLQLLLNVTIQVVGPFIDSSDLLFGDYSPNVMVIAT